MQTLKTGDRITLKQATVLRVDYDRITICIDGRDHHTSVRHENVASVEARPLLPGKAIMKRKPRSVHEFMVVAVHGGVAWVSTNGNPPITRLAIDFENT